MRINKRYVYYLGFVAALGGFLFGFDLVLIGGANVYLVDYFNLDSVAFGFTTKSAHIGCIAGPFLGIWFCDRFDRRDVMFFSAILLGLSAVFTATPNDIVTFNIWRIVGGVGVGLCSVACPIYMVEISPKKMRGSVGLMYQFSVVLGCILAAVTCYVLARNLPALSSWRWMFASEVVAVIPFAVLALLIPRSPRWLVGQGRDAEAHKVLAKIGGEDYAREEMAGLTALRHEKQGSFRDLFSPGVRMALLVAVLLGLFNNLTGWTPINSYLAALFVKAGFDKTEAILRFVVVYGFMGVVSFLPMLIVDKVGRRPLWVFASALMAAALVCVFAVFHYNMSGLWVLGAVALTVVPHAIALGGIPWLVISEVFPGSLRAKGVAFATTILWMANFGGGFAFPLMTNYSEVHFGSVGPAFLVFAFICVLSVIFGLTLMPETRGKSLEDMGKSWKLEKDMPPPQ